MTNIKVSELPSATSFNDEDLVMIVQNNESKKISGENLLNYKFSQYNVAMPNGTQNIYFKRYGHIVEVWYNGDINSLVYFEEITLLNNIPENFKPNHIVRFSVNRSTTENIDLRIYEDGTLKAFNYTSAITSTSNFQFHTTYLVD